MPTLTTSEADLVRRCWQFANTLDPSERLPPPAAQDGAYSALEAYLILLHASNQAGVHRFSPWSLGASGIRLLFPATRATVFNALSQEEWDAFVRETTALRKKLMMHA